MGDDKKKSSVITPDVQGRSNFEQANKPADKSKRPENIWPSDTQGDDLFLKPPKGDCFPN